MLREEDEELNRDPIKGIVGIDLSVVPRAKGLMLPMRGAVLAVALEKV